MIFPILFLVPWCLSGQVINDNIENRIELSTDGSPIRSNTSHCSVQWACVDQNLTGKCVQYHNDQWFFFNSGDKENLYINIYNQVCRDVRGIQMIVLQGTPCEPSTYNIKACISLANQDDIFLALDSLGRNEEYLINVDGYLHDFCKFYIEISQVPKGVPAQLSQKNVDLDFNKIKNFVNISWTIPEGDIYQYYEIYRWKGDQQKSNLITKIPHDRNTYGDSKLGYSYIDTLAEKGLYIYKIVGSTSEGIEYLLAEKQINITKDFLAGSEDEVLLKGKIEVKLNFSEETPLTVLLLNREDRQILVREDFTFHSENNLVFFFIDPYVKNGITRFEVRVIDLLTNKSESHFFGQ